MALVLDHLEATLNFADNSGDISPRTLEADPAQIATFPDWTTALSTIIDDYLAVTDAVLASYRVTAVFIENALTLPASGVENENTAQISAKIFGDPTESAVLSIPAADPDIFVALSGPGAKVVDTSDADVIALLAHFADGGDLMLSDGEHIVPATAKGKRVHKRNNSG